MQGFNGFLKTDSNVKIDNRIYVDAEFGDDSKAERESFSKPFQTIQAALNVYIDGDILIVHTGNHSLSTPIVIPANIRICKMYFEEDAIVEAAFGAPIISTANLANQSYEIHGRGVFRNNTTTGTGAVRVFNGRIEIFGAKSISTANGIIVGQTFWKNIRNVDEFYVDGGSCLTVGTNPEHDLINGGFVENVTIGSFSLGITSVNGIVLAATPSLDQRTQFNNVTIVGESLTGTSCFIAAGGNGNLHVKMKNCRFIGLSRQRIITSSGDHQIEFESCYFENNADLAGVNIGNGTNHTFIDCNFKSNSNGTPILIAPNADVDAPKFFGINKIESNGSFSIVSRQQVKCPNEGTIFTNVIPQPVLTQIWNFSGISTSPTDPDSFTINGNDGSSVTYVVQPGDTQLDVYTGIVAACLAEKALGLNDFENWFFIVTGGPGAYSFRIFNMDTDYNYDTDSGEDWTWSTSGSEPIVQPVAPINGGFVTVGGDFIIDDNLKVF